MKLTSARKLYRLLDIREPFDTWITNNIKKNNRFVRNVDYRVKRGLIVNHYLSCNRVDLELTNKIVKHLINNK